MKLPNQKGFAPVILIVFVATILGIGAFFILNQSQNKAQTKITPQTLVQKVLPTPTPSPWKTYLGEGFEVIYPRAGVIVQDDGYIEGECGAQIKTDPKDKNILLFDNFFKLKEVTWDKTLDEYLISTRAKNAYEVESLDGSGADEAVQLLRLKEGFEVAVGYPPLAFTKAVFKKGEKVYLLQSFNTITNFGGCIMPTIVDPVKYPEVSKQTWDPLTNIKFIP
ncbi:MAG: hypothetical protein Q7R49_00700 [Candidatus Daviesbacteria bacterium]|nr:hypothetical protein [Candidatus Daviesbacteria bacterium]